MRHDFFPTRDNLIPSWSSRFLERILASPESYGLSPLAAEQYQVLHDQFMLAWNGNLAPATRSSYTAARKAAARKSLEDEARRLSRIIQGMPVSEAQKVDLGLSARTGGGRQTLIGAPTTRPTLFVKNVLGRTVTVTIVDAASTRRGRPRGVIGAAVYGWPQPGDPPENLFKWSFLGYATTRQFSGTFNEEVAPGTQVSLAAHWLSTRLEVGPAARPVRTHIGFDIGFQLVQVGVNRKAA